MKAQKNGVKITFKTVSGLSANWLERDIQCHQARFAALGGPASYLPDDPSLVNGAHVEVTDMNGKLTVEITTPDPDAAKLAQDRAKDLVAPAAPLEASN